MRKAVASMPRRRGFALVITVLLLALLVLVLVALATLTRVETSVAGNTRKFSQARQNALLALNEALARLQETAGPDQRVTATAEIVGGGGWLDKWTGVWDSSNPSDVRWLGSGWPDPETPGSPGFPESLEPVTLVGSRTSGVPDDVRVGKLPITVSPYPGMDPNVDYTIGRYAWWVGDEGVKARVNLADQHALQNADSARGRYRLQTVQRLGTEFVSGFDSIPPNSDELERVLANAQLAFVGSTPPTLTAVRSRFHDVTSYSQGLLTNVSDGGLKYDLSPYLARDDIGVVPGSQTIASDVTFDYVKQWWRLGNAAVGLKGSVPPEAFAGANQPGVHPIVVRFSLFIGASHSTFLRQVRLHLMPVIALWNPYDVSLGASDYRVTVDGPLNFSFSGDASGTFSTPNTLGFAILAADFEPGECRFFAAEDWDAYSSSAANNGMAANWSDNRGFYFDTGRIAISPFDVAIDQTGSLQNLRLYLGTGGSAPVIQQVPSLPGYAGQDIALRELAQSSTSSAPDNPFYADMIAHGWSLVRANADVWASLEHRSSLGGPYDWLQAETSDPTRYRAHTGYSWLGGSSADSGQIACVLFEIPRSDQPLLSLGEFQHIRRRHSDWSPTYLFDEIGTMGPAFWDQLFLSGVDTWTGADVPFPSGNYHLIAAPGTGPSLAEVDSDPIVRGASALLAQGMFNINSLSDDAWKAVLSSYADVPIANWSGSAEPAVAPSAPCRHPWSRFSFPLVSSLDPDDPNESADSFDEANALSNWAGYRRLSDEQVVGMAGVFRTRIASDGPYASIADFVNDSVWDDAINAAGINTSSAEVTPPTGAVVTAAVPGRLTKWDLVSRLLPILSVRSDTFVIRAYGEAVNPVTNEIEGKAWCEAVVQRVPDYVDSSDAPWEAVTDLSATNQALGRRFVITQFRWMTEDDI